MRDKERDKGTGRHGYRERGTGRRGQKGRKSETRRVRLGYWITRGRWGSETGRQGEGEGARKRETGRGILGKEDMESERQGDGDSDTEIGKQGEGDRKRERHG